MTIVEEIDKKSGRPHRSKNITDALKYLFKLDKTPQNISEAVKGYSGGGSDSGDVDRVLFEGDVVFVSGVAQENFDSTSQFTFDRLVGYVLKIDGFYDNLPGYYAYPPDPTPSSSMAGYTVSQTVGTLPGNCELRCKDGTTPITVTGVQLSGSYFIKEQEVTKHIKISLVKRYIVS